MATATHSGRRFASSRRRLGELLQHLQPGTGHGGRPADAAELRQPRPVHLRWHVRRRRFTGQLQARRDLQAANGAGVQAHHDELSADHVPPDQQHHGIQGTDHLRHPGDGGKGADAATVSAVAERAGCGAVGAAGECRPDGPDGSSNAGCLVDVTRRRTCSACARCSGRSAARGAIAGGGGRRMMRKALAVASGAVLLTGCQFGGLNSLNMPGTAGHGSGSYKVTVELPDVATLPQNSPVMIDDVTVGSVSGIDAVQRPDGTFYAAVQLSLDEHVKLPANATAKVAQTSLLGSQHIELAAPVDQPGVGKLADGAEIPLNRTGRYPTTEEV